MRKIDTFNLRWRADRIDREITELDERIIKKLFHHPMHLDHQELYLLRESLMKIYVDSKALQGDLADLRTELQVPLWKRLLSK